MSALIDITGRRFGKLTVLGRSTEKRGRKYAWRCQCDCGKITIKNGRHLKRGESRSCGCLLAPIAAERFSLNLVGQKFGRLTVLSRISGSRRNQCLVWRCVCDCGKIISAGTAVLRKGATKSCGCLRSAAQFVRGTNINSLDVPIEVVNTLRARGELKKAIKAIAEQTK